MHITKSKKNIPYFVVAFVNIVLLLTSRLEMGVHDLYIIAGTGRVCGAIHCVYKNGIIQISDN